MDCQRVRRDELIESYLSHRLEEGVSDEFETHVLSCRECSGVLEEMQGLRDGLEEKAASIRSAVTKPSVFRFWRQAAAVGFAVILLVSFGLLRLRRATKHDEDPSLVSKSPHKPAEKVAEVKPPPKSHQSGLDLEVSSGKIPTQPAPAHKSPSDASVNRPSAQPEKTIVAKSSEASTGTSSAGTEASSSEDTKPKESACLPSTLPTVGEGPAAVARNTTPEASTDSAHIKLTSAQGVELFQIGAVEAAPFAFSGFGRHSKDPKGGKTDSLSIGTVTPDTGRVLFQKGMTAYVEGRYDDTIGFLQSAAQRDKRTDDINFYLGVSQILAGHPQEAAVPLGKVIALENSAYLQSAHYYLGKAYVQEMKLDQAESEFRAAAALPGRVTADSKALFARVAALRAQLAAK
jgi:hypothetical protein